VIVLADAHLVQSTETWRVADLKDLPAIERPQLPSSAAETFLPYERDANLARPWVAPGTPGLEHRVSGQEKSESGAVSFDPENHEHLVRTRAAKIAKAAEVIAPLGVTGPNSGDLLVLGWGSTYGAIAAAAEACRQRGLAVAHAHLRHLLPLPKNTGDVLKRYRRVLVPELNAGQLSQVLRSQFPVEIVSFTRIQGRPFCANEIESKIELLLRESS
jgi:2-oxoglutarate ferredoxin oxidoreductase subunit alpha